MAVDFDSQSFKDLTSTGGTWTHTPVGTPRGVGAMVVINASTCDSLQSVTFGGGTLTRVSFATVSTGEPGIAYLYYKGSAVAASGTINIVNSTATVSNAFTGWAFTVTANQAWTEIAGSAAVNAGTLANPSATLSVSPGDTGIAVGVLFSGQSAPSSCVQNSGFTCFTGSTRGGRDFGTQSAAAEWSTAYQQGPTIPVGWTATGEQVAAIGALIREVVPSIGTMPMINFALETT